MNNAKLKELLLLAAQEGVAPRELIYLAGKEGVIEEGRVSRNNLMSIYARRLKRAAGDPQLHESTLELVEFLRNFPSEELNMISIRTTAGGFHLFIADLESTKILFWMRMFSSPPQPS